MFQRLDSNSSALLCIMHTKINQSPSYTLSWFTRAKSHFGQFPSLKNPPVFVSAHITIVMCGIFAAIKCNNWQNKCLRWKNSYRPKCSEIKFLSVQWSMFTPPPPYHLMELCLTLKYTSIQLNQNKNYTIHFVTFVQQTLLASLYKEWLNTSI